jgi:hypothetical protein
VALANVIAAAHLIAQMSGRLGRITPDIIT